MQPVGQLFLRQTLFFTQLGHKGTELYVVHDTAPFQGSIMPKPA